MRDNDLVSLGFVHAGSCSLAPALKSGVRFSISQLRQDRTIYAFTSDGEVKYIGVCDNTATCLFNRMGRYQSLAGAGTNKRIADLIKVALVNGKAVEIYAWKPAAAQPVVIQSLAVDLVKGLENPPYCMGKT